MDVGGCAYRRHMSRTTSYTDAELALAVSSCSSWRAVLRALGLTATSSSAIRSVRRHAELAGLDYSHFKRLRRWSEDELRDAIALSTSWQEVTARLRLSESTDQRLQAHANRLGISTSHLGGKPLRAHSSGPANSPSLAHLRNAAPLLAAASLEMRGHRVSWPLEPARYDLVVDLAGRLTRVQVKTTTHKQGDRWTVWLSSTSPTRTIYSPDDVDAFYVIDGDLTHYWIPLARVAGLQAIALSAYRDTILATTPAVPHDPRD